MGSRDLASATLDIQCRSSLSLLRLKNERIIDHNQIILNINLMVINFVIMSGSKVSLARKINL